MIRIELKRVFKEGLIIFMIIAALFIAILKTDKDAYIAPAIELFLLLYASFSGWSIFNREREEGALEYMLTLPVSRPKLLLIKFTPRIFLLTLVYICYCFLNKAFSLPALLNVTDFAVFFFIFFLVSASFSISLRSFIGTFFLTAMLSSGLTFFDNIFSQGTISSETIVRSNMVLLALPILFFIFFFRFDLKPLLKFNLRFIGYSSLIIILMIGIRFFQIERYWCLHMMTNEGSIYRMSPRGLQFIEEGKMFKKGKCFWPLVEQGDYLYLQDHKQKRGMKNKDIYIFNKKNSTLDKFHNTEKGWRTVVTRPLHTASILSGEMFFLQKNRILNNFRITSIKGGKVKHYPLNIEEINPKDMYFITVLKDPLRFVIRTHKNVVFFNTEGNVEKIISASALSIWKNKLLIFNQGIMKLFEIGEKITTKFSREGKFRKILRRFGSVIQEKVVFRNGKDSFIFSFKNDSIMKRKVNRNLFYYKVINNKFYLVYLTAEGVAADIYEENKLIGHESWETGMSGYRRVLVFEKGIVVSNGKEYEKYLFKE